MVDTGLQYSNGFLSVDSTIATKQYVDNAIGSGSGGGATYTAGTGVDITNDVISVDNTVALKTDIPTYTAGDGITIENNVISATSSGGGSGTDTDTKYVYTFDNGASFPLTGTAFEDFRDFVSANGWPTQIRFKEDTSNNYQQSVYEFAYFREGKSGFIKNGYYVKQPPYNSSTLSLKYTNEYIVIAIDDGNQQLSKTTNYIANTIPTAPLQDGTYILTTTVSNYVATNEWTALGTANGNNF